MRATIVNDGRKIGLVLLDELVTEVVDVPGLPAASPTSPTAVCDLTKSQLTPPSILDCTAQTFITGGSAVLLLGRRPALERGGQSSLGRAAISRAQNNPF